MAKMPIARYKKVHELLCMQLLQGIVRGQPDCECKEGCKGDPFKKCDCDLPNPANETLADPGNSGTATIPLLAPTATETRPSKMEVSP